MKNEKNYEICLGDGEAILHFGDATKLGCFEVEANIQTNYLVPFAPKTSTFSSSELVAKEQNC